MKGWIMDAKFFWGLKFDERTENACHNEENKEKVCMCVMCVCVWGGRNSLPLWNIGHSYYSVQLPCSLTGRGITSINYRIRVKFGN